MMDQSGHNGSATNLFAVFTAQVLEGIQACSGWKGRMHLDLLSPLSKANQQADKHPLRLLSCLLDLHESNATRYVKNKQKAITRVLCIAGDAN